MMYADQLQVEEVDRRENGVYECPHSMQKHEEGREIRPDEK